MSVAEPELRGVLEVKKIMDWMDKVVYESETYDSMTEAVKWAIL